MEIEKLIHLFETLRDVDSEMPISKVIALLMVAKHGQMTLTEWGDKAGISPATATRYAVELSKPLRDKEKGLGFISSERDPENRRKVLVNMSTKGRNFINRLLGTE